MEPAHDGTGVNESLRELIDRMIGWHDAGRRGVMCAVVGARGSTPQNAGAVMLVDETATTHGTIGGGCVEAEVRRAAHRLLAEHRLGVMTFKLDHDYGWDDGLICGGTIHVAVAAIPDRATLQRVREAINRRESTVLPIETANESGEAARYQLRLPPRDRLYIAGAGHVGQALARLAGPLDFDVHLFDDREDLLEQFAPASVTCVAGDMVEQLAAHPIDAGTFCVIVTRGHRHDEQALHAVLGRGAGYVGMIGSRRKVKLIFDDLRAVGVANETLQQVHAPIGVPIEAVTVEEIALSIAAQLVQVRRAERRAVIEGPMSEPAEHDADCAGAVSSAALRTAE